MGYVREITLPWPEPELRSNSRAHYMAKARATKHARNHAWARAMETPRIKRIPDATIFIEYYPKARREDIHNVPSSLKAYIDGIADAMGCDDSQFRVDYPTEWAGTDPRGKVVFRVVESAGNWRSVGEIADKLVKDHQT